MLDSEVETGNWMSIGVALGSCSSSCLIWRFMDSTSSGDSGIARVDALVELSTIELDAWLGAIDPLLVLEALPTGIDSRDFWASPITVVWP